MKYLIRVLVCFTVVVSIFAYTLSPINAYAVGEEVILGEVAPGPLFALWVTGLAKKYTDKRVDYVKSLSGDEFYDWYNGKGGIEADLWRNFNRIYSLENKYGSDHPLPGTIFSASIPNESEVEMEKAHYNAAFIDKSFLHYLDARTRTAINSEIRYTTLEDLHLTVTDTVSINNINVVVRNVSEPEVVKNMGSSWKITIPYDVYYDFSAARTDKNRVSIYTGGKLPPMIYIPQDLHVYQNGVLLNSNNIYIVMGDNLLYNTGISYTPNGMIGYHYYNTGASTDTLIFESAHLKIDSNTNNSTYGLPVAERRSGNGYIYSDGVQANQINRSPYQGWVMLDRIEKLCGYCIDYNGSISEAPNLPGYIPYDDDDMVIVLVSDTGDNVYYIDPSDYYSYVTNGDIVEGDYNVADYYNDSTINDVVNQYNNYVNNSSGSGSDSGSGSGSYDDSNVISRLDTIINWLQRIHNKIDLAGKTEEMTSIFSDEPVYIEFSDCVFDHIGVSDDVEGLIDDVDVDTDSNGVEEILEYKDTGQTITNASDLRNVFSGLTVNVNWYSPYRIRIRNLLKIPCWILGIVSIWRMLKSTFGLGSSAEG